MKRMILSLTAALMLPMAATAAEAPSYTITPTPDKPQTMLGTINVTFDSPVYFREGLLDEDGEPVSVVTLIYVDPTIKEFYCYTPENTDGQGLAYTFNFVSDWDYPETSPGEYELVMDYMYNVEDGVETNYDPISVFYYIPYAYNYKLTPSPSNCQDLQGLKIFYPDQHVNAWIGHIEIGNLVTRGKDYRCKVPEFDYDPESGTTVTFTFEDAFSSDDAVPEHIDATGDYLLTIKGIYPCDSNGNPDGFDYVPLYVKYHLPTYGEGEPEPEVPTVTFMEKGVVVSPVGEEFTKIEEVRVIYNEGEAISLVAAEEESPFSTIPVSIRMETVDPEEIPWEAFQEYPYIENVLTENGMESQLVISFDTLNNKFFEEGLPDGTYVVTIPMGLVQSEAGALNPSQSFSFVINTGKNSLKVIESGKEGAVYSLQGVKVGDSLKGLPGGIYIQDGKVIFIKK